MHVFVTGASGFVGSAVVAELVAAGHRVTGLVRSPQAATSVEAAGATACLGSLEDLAGLTRGAEGADAVIHTAFNHDFSKYAASCEADRHIIAALARPLAGSARPLVVTSALGVLPQGRVLDETMSAPADGSAHPRAATEQAARAARESGVKVAVLRLPPSTHGVGDRGFVPMLIDIARQRGRSAWPGAGANRWSAVHRLDAARLYRLIVESATPAGIYHAVADEGIAFREIAEAIGRRLGLPAHGVTGDAVAAHFGGFAHFAAMDLPATARLTCERLSWQPVQPGLLEDLDGPAYFG